LFAWQNFETGYTLQKSWEKRPHQTIVAGRSCFSARSSSDLARAFSLVFFIDHWIEKSNEGNRL